MGFPGSVTISKVPSHYSGKQSFRHHSAVTSKTPAVPGFTRRLPLKTPTASGIWANYQARKQKKQQKANNHLEQLKFFINIGGGYTNSKADSL